MAQVECSPAFRVGRVGVPYFIFKQILNEAGVIGKESLSWAELVNNRVIDMRFGGRERGSYFVVRDLLKAVAAIFGYEGGTLTDDMLALTLASDYWEDVVKATSEIFGIDLRTDSEFAPRIDRKQSE